MFGEVVGGKAFGNWTVWADDGRQFTGEGMVLYHAPRTSAGKDRTDPAILLEVYEWIRDREDCGTVILGSGDADYQALVDRARNHGRRSCCAPSANRCPGTCWLRRRCFRWRRNWAFNWRSMATSTCAFNERRRLR